MSTWDIFVTIIISGGIVAGSFEWLRDTLARRRQEYLDISKIKIDYISKSLPYYGQLSFYNYMLSKLLRTKRYATYFNLILYYICSLLYLENKYFKTFGAIQLGSSDAETVLESINTDFKFMIATKIGQRNISLLSNILRDDLPYHEFEDFLKVNETIVKDFCEIFSDSQILEELEKRCRYFHELITLEVNDIYKEWYKKEIPSYNINDDTIDYIKNRYPFYHSRIISLVNWSTKRRITHPLLWRKIKNIQRGKLHENSISGRNTSDYWYT